MKVITGKDILTANNDVDRVRLLLRIIKGEVKYEKE